MEQIIVGVDGQCYFDFSELEKKTSSNFVEVVENLVNAFSSSPFSYQITIKKISHVKTSVTFSHCETTMILIYDSVLETHSFQSHFTSDLLGAIYHA